MCPHSFSLSFRISHHTIPDSKTFFLIQLRHIISSIYKSICHLLNISSQNEQFITTCSLKINFIYRSHCRFLLWPRVAFQSINNSFNFTIRAKSESIITVSFQTVCRTIITCHRATFSHCFSWDFYTFYYIQSFLITL